MSDREEPPLMTLILFPFRLIGLLAELVTLLWLILLCGGLVALLGAFLWLILTGP